MKRGRLAIVASPASKLAHQEAVTLSELSDQTFLVNPRSLAPAAYEGLNLMCRKYGGCDPTPPQSAAPPNPAPTTALRTTHGRTPPRVPRVNDTTDAQR